MTGSWFKLLKNGFEKRECIEGNFDLEYTRVLKSFQSGKEHLRHVHDCDYDAIVIFCLGAGSVYSPRFRTRRSGKADSRCSCWTSKAGL